jgi:hypothetical protein
MRATWRPGICLVVLLAAASMAGCSQRDARDKSRLDERQVTNADLAGPGEVHRRLGGVDGIAAREGAAQSAAYTPGISPAAAPGVAFSYRYAFVLPDKTIAAIQEQHASACEKLGPTQCRIIGMRYTLIDEDQVEAYLQLKLAPDIARGFGKEGITAVDKADGKLVDALIEGRDVGAQITDSNRRSAELRNQLTAIERQLANSGLDQSTRQQLQQQVERIRSQLAAENKGRDESEELLAQTPMIFTYAGEQGFTLGSNPIGDAAGGAWSSFAFMVSTILLALGIALPWLLLAGLLLLAFRSGPGRRALAWLKPAPRDTEMGDKAATGKDASLPDAR